jgi:hypothetical protein
MVATNWLHANFCLVIYSVSASFLLVYINCTKGFHCDIFIHEYNVLWSNSPPQQVFLECLQCARYRGMQQ